MQLWRDRRTGLATDLGEVWSVEKDGRRIECRLQGHPMGIEARLVFDGELRQTEAFSDSRVMIDVTNLWRLSLERKGWRQC